MITVSDLGKKTNDFFDLHWGENIKEKAPKWSEEKWIFKGSIPNREKPGCYALLSKDETIIYIGVGAGKGQGGIYKGWGLGHRLKRYWRVKKNKKHCHLENREYEPTEKWNDIAAIITIGFPKEYWYLAYALEQFLIAELNPPRNSAGKK